MSNTDPNKKNYIIDNIIVNNHGLLGLTPNNELVYSQPKSYSYKTPSSILSEYGKTISVNDKGVGATKNIETIVKRKNVLVDITGKSEVVLKRTKTPEKSEYVYGKDDDITGISESVKERKKTPLNSSNKYNITDDVTNNSEGVIKRTKT